MTSRAPDPPDDRDLPTRWMVVFVAVVVVMLVSLVLTRDNDAIKWLVFVLLAALSAVRR